MKKIAFFAVALLTSVASTDAMAATVFQSLPDLTVRAQSNAWCSSCGGTPYKVFDKFTLASASNLTSVTFAVQTSYRFPTAVEVGFHNLAGNLPGSQIASFSFLPSQFTSTSATPFDTTLVTVALPGLALAAGSYDISFFNATGLGIPGYANAGGVLYQQGVGIRAGQSAAFSLQGTSGAVPEPATWGMMIAGFGLVGGAMRRRSSARVTYA